MNPIIYITLTLIDIYSWAILIAVIMSWLISLRILNPHNNLVSSIYQFFVSITEPVLRPIRRFFSIRSGFDYSPIIVYLLLNFLGYTIKYYALS